MNPWAASRLFHKCPNERRDFVCFGIEREMSRVEDVDFCVRQILAIAFRLAGIEREIVLTPNHEETWLSLLHPCLPLRVGVDVRSIIVEKITLNVGLAGLVEKIKFIGPKVRVIAIHIRIVSDMAGSRGCQRKKICAQRIFVGGAIFPEFAPRLPVRAKAFVMPSRVLNNERVDALRVRQRHSETDRAAVIVHVKRVTREAQRFRESDS